MKLRVSPSWERIIEQYIHTKEIILVKEEKCRFTSYSQIFKGITNMFKKLLLTKYLFYQFYFQVSDIPCLFDNPFEEKILYLSDMPRRIFFLNHGTSTVWPGEKGSNNTVMHHWIYSQSHTYTLYIYILHIHIRIYNTCVT